MKEVHASPAGGAEQRGDTPGATERRGYEAPKIVWREVYEPVSFGISCAKEPGNPPCVGFYSG
jgi:hypothetical protein